jgi:hypothetical protein
MLWPRLLPAILSYAVLGASLLRSATSFGGWFFAACVGLLPLLLLDRRPWVPKALAGGLLLSSPRWLWIAWNVAQERMIQGRPYVRMAVILGGVALVSLAAAWLLQGTTVRARYGQPRK